jgi:hypothetical protein
MVSKQLFTPVIPAQGGIQPIGATTAAGPVRSLG